MHHRPTLWLKSFPPRSSWRIPPTTVTDCAKLSPRRELKPSFQTPPLAQRNIHSTSNSTRSAIWSSVAFQSSNNFGVLPPDTRKRPGTIEPWSLSQRQYCGLNNCSQFLGSVWFNRSMTDPSTRLLFRNSINLKNFKQQVINTRFCRTISSTKIMLGPVVNPNLYAGPFSRAIVGHGSFWSGERMASNSPGKRALRSSRRSDRRYSLPICCCHTTPLSRKMRK